MAEASLRQRRLEEPLPGVRQAGGARGRRGAGGERTACAEEERETGHEQRPREAA